MAVYYVRQVTFIPVRPVKTTRFATLSLAALIFVSANGMAQSNAKPDYKHQHKSAEQYQKSLLKKSRKQQKAAADAAKANRKKHS